MYMADRIKVLGRNGTILQTGTPHEIYYHPTDEFVARLFGLMNTIEGVVQNSVVQTAFGAVDAGKHKDGKKVRVLIRPEGFVLETSDNEDGIGVDVESTHLIGHSSVVRIKPVLDQDSSQEYLVRVHKDMDPELGHRIIARIDPEHCFVFPADSDDPYIETPDFETLLSADPETGIQADTIIEGRVNAAE